MIRSIQTLLSLALFFSVSLTVSHSQSGASIELEKRKTDTFSWNGSKLYQGKSKLWMFRHGDGYWQRLGAHGKNVKYYLKDSPGAMQAFAKYHRQTWISSGGKGIMLIGLGYLAVQAAKKDGDLSGRDLVVGGSITAAGAGLSIVINKRSVATIKNAVQLYNEGLTVNPKRIEQTGGITWELRNSRSAFGLSLAGSF